MRDACLAICPVCARVEDTIDSVVSHSRASDFKCELKKSGCIGNEDRFLWGLCVISKRRVPRLPQCYRRVLTRGQIWRYFDDKMPAEFKARKFWLFLVVFPVTEAMWGQGLLSCSQSTTFSSRFPQEASFHLPCTTPLFSRLLPLGRLPFISMCCSLCEVATSLSPVSKTTIMPSSMHCTNCYRV